MSAQIPNETLIEFCAWFYFNILLSFLDTFMPPKIMIFACFDFISLNNAGMFFTANQRPLFAIGNHQYDYLMLTLKNIL